MVNGPLGGSMATPPVAPQPPQVSFETTAQSRGNFNNFLKSIPTTTAMTPIAPLGSAPTMPTFNPMANIDIFNQPTGMMGMNQPPMNPMMQPPSNAGIGLMPNPVQNFFFGGSAMSGGGFSDAEIGSQIDDFDSGQEDTSDSFDANMGLSDQEVEDIFSGEDDPTPPPLPTPRPEILKEAVARAEKEVFGGTESDALQFFNDQGKLTPTGQRAFDDAIKGNLVALQEPEVAPAGGGLQLASLFDNTLIPAGAKSTTAGDISANAFGVSPSRTVDTKQKTVLDNLTLDDLNLLQSRPDVLRTGTALPAFPTTTSGVAPFGVQGAGSRGDIVRPNVPISRGIQDLTREDQQLIAPEIFGTGQIAGMDENTFRSLSDDAQQKILSDIATADLGTTFTPYDPEPNRGIVPDTALETMARDRRDIFQPDDITFDPITIEEDDLTTVSPDLLSSIGREQRIDDANTFRSTFPDSARIFGDKKITTTPTGQDLELSPIVAPGIPAPKEFKDPFPDAGINIGNVTIPTLTSLANRFSQYSRGRVLDSIAQKGYTPVYSGDVIVGAKDKFGNLMEGIDPNAPMGSDDNQEPIIRRPIVAAKEEEEKEDEKPPNVIGGGDTPTPPAPTSVVVDSPFTSNVSHFVPSTFNTADLNKLIESLTGIPAPRRAFGGPVPMQNGGVINAVDKFLATT